MARSVVKFTFLLDSLYHHLCVEFLSSHANRSIQILLLTEKQKKKEKS